MEEIWVVYLCFVLFILVMILMKLKPDDEIKEREGKEHQSFSTSTSQLMSSAGRVLEHTEEELEASLQRLSHVLFSTDTQKRHPHADHGVPPHQEKVSHPASHKNIMEEIEQAVQEPADTDVHVRRRPGEPASRRRREDSQ